MTLCGSVGYNLTKHGLTETKLSDCGESWVEMITHHIDLNWGHQLLDCIAPN